MSIARPGPDRTVAGEPVPPEREEQPGPEQAGQEQARARFGRGGLTR
ncbi:hypothetical protein OG711_10555 [Streptomyces uncialis]|nr:hypothetical protein [Streptomyces uncialis]MCX4659705.1 hypothetical protein [Streptomyces uncialis]